MFHNSGKNPCSSTSNVQKSHQRTIKTKHKNMGQTPFHSVGHSKRISNLRGDVSKETCYQINKLIVI